MFDSLSPGPLEKGVSHLSDTAYVNEFTLQRHPDTSFLIKIVLFRSFLIRLLYITVRKPLYTQNVNLELSSNESIIHMEFIQYVETS